jgi:hypothetical protein
MRPRTGTRFELTPHLAATVLAGGGIYLEAEGIARTGAVGRVYVELDAEELLTVAAALAELTGRPYVLGPYEGPQWAPEPTNEAGPPPVDGRDFVSLTDAPPTAAAAVGTDTPSSPHNPPETPP